MNQVRLLAQKADTVQCHIRGFIGSRHGLETWKSKTLPLDGGGGLRNTLRCDWQVRTSTRTKVPSELERWKFLHTRYHAKQNVNKTKLPVRWKWVRNLCWTINHPHWGHGALRVGGTVWRIPKLCSLWCLCRLLQLSRSTIYYLKNIFFLSSISVNSKPN